MKNDTMWGNSECIDSWLHRFEIVMAHETGVMERCTICGTEQFFPVVNGTTDNAEYLSYHARQALMKQHELFYHEYEYEYSHRR